MTKLSTDYHDYVFLDGKLVGKFEEMYQNSTTAPWNQDEQGDMVDVRLTKQMLKDIGSFDEIHDLGCGLGHYLQLMREGVGAANCKGFGYDISATACEKAKQQFPEFEFSQLDLTSVPAPITRELQPTARRLFMIRGTLWYVFPKLDAVIDTIRGLMTGCDKLLVVQNFPPLAGPFIGKEVIPSPSALIDHFSSDFMSVRHIWYEDTLKAVNDNWFIGLFTLGDTK